MLTKLLPKKIPIHRPRTMVLKILRLHFLKKQSNPIKMEEKAVLKVTPKKTLVNRDPLGRGLTSITNEVIKREANNEEVMRAKVTLRFIFYPWVRLVGVCVY